MMSESEHFISELPDYKKIKTYARQKPIRLKRQLTVGVEYENLFINGKKQNVDTTEKRQKVHTLKEITNTVKNRRKGANYRTTKRRGGLQRLLKEKNQEMDLVKQVTCKDNDGGILNAVEIVLDQKANDPGKSLTILEAMTTDDQDAIISPNKDCESTEVNCFPLFMDSISPSPSNCFILPTTSTPIQREKDRQVTDFNFECTPIVSCDNQMEKTVKLNEYNLQTPMEKTDKLNEYILQTPIEKTDKTNEHNLQTPMEKTDKLNEYILQTPMEKTDKTNELNLQTPMKKTNENNNYLQTPVEKTHKLNKHILQAPVQEKEMFTCLLVASLTETPTVEINSINTISHVVKIKKLSCVPLDVLVL